jgi:hypothetical protein
LCDSCHILPLHAQSPRAVTAAPLLVCCRKIPSHTGGRELLRAPNVSVQQFEY